MPKTKKHLKISVIGLGNLGLPLAVTLAEKHPVIGMDIDTQKISSLKKGNSPLFEPQLQKTLQKNSANLSFTTNIKKAISQTSLTFLVLPTPSKPNGSFSLKHIKKALKTSSTTLKNKNSFHTLIITSTINPQSTKEEIIPFLEKHTGKKVGKELGLAYLPELIALGSVINDLKNPEVIFFASSDPKTRKIVEKTRLSICQNSPTTKHLNFLEAEIAKLALNSYITTKISFANLLARFAEKFKETDAEKITQTIGQDSRVGTKYLQGAIAYGGPCFPRDNQSLIHALEKTQTPSNIPQSIHQFNQSQHTYLAQLVKKNTQKNQTVGILGLSYKPQTDIIQESPGIKLAQLLAQDNYSVTVYDPQALPKAKKKLKNKVSYATSLKNLIQTSQTIVITTPWKEFEKLPQHLKNQPKTLIDCWQQLSQLKNNKNLKYLALGKGKL